MERLIQLAIVSITAPFWLPMAREIRDQILGALREGGDAPTHELISIRRHDPRLGSRGPQRFQDRDESGAVRSPLRPTADGSKRALPPAA